VRTLPDYLQNRLELVFIGINPGTYSAQTGHYYATPRNRFWHAFNGAKLLGEGVVVGPSDDSRMNDMGIGFTDIVKRSTNNAGGLRTADFRKWIPLLERKLLKYQPRVICFNGFMALGKYLLYSENSNAKLTLGLQSRKIGLSHIFLVPSSSPANASYSLGTLIHWYEKLASFRDQVVRGLGQRLLE
jgi:TDG/mug DNA glycosylase family protein